MKVPSQVLVHSQSRSLELIYDDGEHSVFSFEFLRVMSPSADVAGHTPDEAVLQVGKRDVTLKGVEPVGLYALKLIFQMGMIQAFTAGIISKT